MSFFYTLLLALLTVSCSDKIEKNKAPKNNIFSIEKKSAQSLNSQSKPIADENISGSSQPRISGGPSSSHISGQ